MLYSTMVTYFQSTHTVISTHFAAAAAQQGHLSQDSSVVE